MGISDEQYSRKEIRVFPAARSRVQQLVALLPSLQTLDSFAVHLLCHLFIPFLFILCGSAIFNSLDMGLELVVSKPWQPWLWSVSSPDALPPFPP